MSVELKRLTFGSWVGRVGIVLYSIHPQKRACCGGQGGSFRVDRTCNWPDLFFKAGRVKESSGYGVVL
jgi:hypothetical protein